MLKELLKVLAIALFIITCICLASVGFISLMEPKPIPGAAVWAADTPEARVRLLAMSSELGWASWYGQEWHGRSTSSGEIYDARGFTVASRVLPLGTIVMVENLLNDRFVVAAVSDRGPFLSGRSLDVSLKIAEKLGMLEIGVCPVRISVLRLEGK